MSDVDDDTDPDEDPAALAESLDTLIDTALAACSVAGVESWPEDAQQVYHVLLAADVIADSLLEALGVPDPDEDATALTSVADILGSVKL